VFLFELASGVIAPPARRFLLARARAFGGPFPPCARPRASGRFLSSTAFDKACAMRVKQLGLAGLSALALAMAFAPATAAPSAATYRNPILHADYSDPDVIRVGDSYYMVASSFHFSPGLPVLKSKDLVHWTILGHVLPKLTFAPEYDLPGPVPTDDTGARMPRDQRTVGQRYAGGVWAPSIRHHDGLFYVYFPTPNEGIFVSTATKPEGPWSAPVAVIAEAGLEDPCPFWDDDGQAYLIHGKVGAGPLVLHRMAPDGKSVLPGGKVIVEDAKALPVLEGPSSTSATAGTTSSRRSAGSRPVRRPCCAPETSGVPTSTAWCWPPATPPGRAPTKAAGSRPRPARAGSSTSTAPAPMAGSSTCSRCPGRTTGR
jgi:hypothetical protein